MSTAPVMEPWSGRHRADNKGWTGRMFYPKTTNAVRELKVIKFA